MDVLIDRRVFERMQEDFSGWYALKNSDEMLGKFSGLDFSAGGLRVRANKKIVEGRALELNIVSPEAKTPIRETAQIVWQREVKSPEGDKPGRYEAGVEFYRPDLARLWPLVNPKQYSEE